MGYLAGLIVGNNYSEKEVKGLVDYLSDINVDRLRILNSTGLKTLNPLFLLSLSSVFEVIYIEAVGEEEVMMETFTRNLDLGVVLGETHLLCEGEDNFYGFSMGDIEVPFYTVID